MGISAITRKKAVVTVSVDNRPRRFVLRAHSVAQHLELLELQESARKQALEEVGVAGDSKSEAARADLTATLAVITHLLQEPADNGHGLTDEESWLLGLEDPSRVLALQHKLSAVEEALGSSQKGKEAPSTEQLIEEWLDIGTTIARAGLAAEPHTPLNEWSMGQVVETYWRACRELWRETDLRVRLAGGKGGEEPSFRPPHKGLSGNSRNLDSAPFTADDEVRYAAMKAKYEAGTRDPEGRKFPGTL